MVGRLACCLYLKSRALSKPRSTNPGVNSRANPAMRIGERSCGRHPAFCGRGLPDGSDAFGGGVVRGWPGNAQAGIAEFQSAVSPIPSRRSAATVQAVGRFEAQKFGSPAIQQAGNLLEACATLHMKRRVNGK